MPPGSVIAGKYRVEGLLGKGGMGEVYAARHVTLDGLFAIKFLTAGALEHDEALARFRAESRAAAQLTNEHVAKICDVGIHDDDLPYIVMEHLEGEDLGAVAEARGPLPVAEVSLFALQICEALAEAHALGIVHRDIKPGNLFLTQRSGEPHVKVLDFGISKTLGAGDLTRTASVLGSPKYMSPEQMNDPRSVDARSDIWSLGVVLYRLVSGRLPFDGDTIGRICTLVMRDPPPPLRQVRRDLTPGFERVVERCLQKDAERRFQNVANLAASLVPFAPNPEHARQAAERVAQILGVAVPSGSPSHSADPPSSTRPVWFGAIVGVGLVLAVVGGKALWSARGATPVTDHAALVEASVTIATDPPAATPTIAIAQPQPVSSAAEPAPGVAASAVPLAKRSTPAARGSRSSPAPAPPRGIRLPEDRR